MRFDRLSFSLICMEQFPEAGRCHLDVTLWSYFYLHLQLAEILLCRVINLKLSAPVDNAASVIITVYCSSPRWRKSQAGYRILPGIRSVWALGGLCPSSGSGPGRKTGRSWEESCPLERSKGVYLSHAIVIFCFVLFFWGTEHSLQMHSLKHIVFNNDKKNDALASFLTDLKSLHCFAFVFFFYITPPPPFLKQDS